MARQLESEVEVQASPERVWEVLTDVEYWSEWTETVTSVRRLDDGPLRPGSRAKISQPRIPETEYVVTELSGGQSFTWVATSPGMRTTARHDLEGLPDADRRVQLRRIAAGMADELETPQHLHQQIHFRL